MRHVPAIMLAACLGISAHPAQAAVSSLTYQDLIGTYCGAMKGVRLVECLTDVLRAIKHEKQGLEEFPTVFDQIRGQLLGPPVSHTGCSAVTILGPTKSSYPTHTKGTGFCAADWNAYSTAMQELTHEACVVKYVYRDSKRIERLNGAAEAAEAYYEDCFTEQLTEVHKDFYDRFQLRTSKQFFDTFDEIEKQYITFKLDDQAARAFALCKAEISEIARKSRATAEDLVRANQCQ